MTARRPQLPAWWYGDAAPPFSAQLLSQVYGGAIALRTMLYRGGILRRRRAAIPVVVVGNLTAGGTGKTPLTIALVERLRAAGWRPGVASRGYGRSDTSQPLWVDTKSDPHEAGDEPVLIARRSGAKVRVDRDRVRAANALDEAGCDIVVCDDGLQHYRLARDIEIEVIDGARRYGNGRLLPAGP
ncbi:MAG: tetraacyldisaccharide 4'-kinase, partial [Pseudomonadota bacterium]|nr:tetraacyldisaccharide 4'-kinase [Pseudomonadota bacterium]